MGVRADWGTASLLESGPEVDPFQATDFNVMLSDATTPISNKPTWGQATVTVETPMDQLRARMGGLLKREAALFDRGVTCPLKDNPEMSCIACPFSKAEAPEQEAECQLCRIGVGQERLSTIMLAKQHGAVLH